MRSTQRADHMNLGNQLAVHLDRLGHDTPDSKAAALVKCLCLGVAFSNSQVKLLQLRQRSGMGQQRLNQFQTQSMTAPLWRDVQADQRGVMPLFDPIAPLQAYYAQQ